ncbi:MAG: hypothetical protein IKH75_06940 [Ruminococcus sp.]|nr:hypothetical protein [Ruminococcus sp.]
MSEVKSFAVGNGDMFYILHGSDNFSIIDCCYKDEKQQDLILDIIKTYADKKGITRFISTHPDEDHIKGLVELDDKIHIRNFYVVENSAIKEDQTDSFKRYCDLRDGDYHYYVYKGCKRKWMNKSDEERGCSGINFLWPDLGNKDFKNVLESVKEGNSPNNLSPIFTYSVENGVVMMWMGDMETEFLDKIKDEIDWPKVDVLFAPHHGRKSGHVSSDVLKKLSPKVIVIGEAPSEDLNYYSNYNTIKQNSSGDITFICKGEVVRIYVENFDYSYEIEELIDDGAADLPGAKYLGSFKPYAAE